MFEPAVSGHGSFFTSQTTSWSSVRATSRPQTDDRTGLPVRPQTRCRSGNRSHRRNHHDAATAVRLSEVDASGDALSAPITVNNSGIDARNGQAYHGRKTIATNGTRPAVLGSRASKGQREKWRWRRPLTSRVRPSPGAAGRTRMLRVGAEAAIDASSMR